MPGQPSGPLRLSGQPSGPLRLSGILLLGGLLPLGGLGALILTGVALGRMACVGEDAEVLVYPAFFAWAGAAALGWRLFRSRPLPPVDPTPLEETPALAALLTQIEAGVRGARVRRLWIHRGFRVHLQARPVFGPLGWASHGWALGAFTLMHLTPRELEAALLWDQAFWSRQHGWLNLEAKRILQFWADVAHALQPEGKPGGPTPAPSALAKPLLAWARWIERLGDPFRFDQVMVADRSVAAALGALTTAQMLTKEALTEFQVDVLWYRPWAESLASVPEAPLAEAQAFLKAWPGPEVEARLEALQEGWVQGMGAFRLRLEALGVAPELPRPPVRSAWEHFLLEDAPGVAVALEAEWRTELEGKLAAWGRELEQAQVRYRDWAARDSGDPLPERDLPEMAHLAVAHGSEAEARAWLQRWMAADPTSANAKVAWARFILPREPEAGLAVVEELRSLHPFNGAVAADLEAEHLARTRPGSPEALQARKAAYEAAQILAWAEEERQKVMLSDAFGPHEAPEPFLTALRAWLGGLQGLSRAYLVRKQVRHLPEAPVFLVVIVRRGFLRALFGSRDLGQWQNLLVKSVPACPKGRVFLIVLRGRHRLREGRFRRWGAPLVLG